MGMAEVTKHRNPKKWAKDALHFAGFPLPQHGMKARGQSMYLISAQFNAFKEYRPEGILLGYLQGYDFTIKPFHSSYLGIGCYISYY